VASKASHFLGLACQAAPGLLESYQDGEPRSRRTGGARRGGAAVRDRTVFQSKRSADLSCRSAAFCCQLGTNRRPPKQVFATRWPLGQSVRLRCTHMQALATHNCTLIKTMAKWVATAPPSCRGLASMVCPSKNPRQADFLPWLTRAPPGFPQGARA
jgi:hypothetical protein